LGFVGFFLSVLFFFLFFYASCDVVVFAVPCLFSPFYFPIFAFFSVHLYVLSVSSRILFSFTNIFLPSSPTTNLPFDPLHVSSLTPQNLSLYTVYTSPNGFLELVSVPPYWSVALKLVRWGRRDWGDVGILLR